MQESAKKSRQRHGKKWNQTRRDKINGNPELREQATARRREHYHRDKDLTNKARRERYAHDAEYAKRVRQRNNAKYADDEEYRKRVVAASRARYSRGRDLINARRRVALAEKVRAINAALLGIHPRDRAETTTGGWL